LFYLHKILPFFLSPLGLVLLLLIVFFFNKRKSFVFLSLLILLISSNPFLGNYLAQKLEHPYKPISYDKVLNAQAIVVLSAGISQVKEEDILRYQWATPNRFFAGVNLFKKNKSKKLIFTGGRLPWNEKWDTTGLIYKKKAIELGIDKNNIYVSGIVKNTYEESVKVKELIPKVSNIILVTSALHMQRSKLLFEKQGFIVNSFPVDFHKLSSKKTILNFIPSLSALSRTSMFIRENIGRLYYKIIL